MSNSDIQKNNVNVAMTDNFEHLLSQNKPFILNTDISSGQGIHYITLFKYTPTDVYIIDSLGKNNFRPYDTLMFNTLNDNNLNYSFYPYKFQTKMSVKCGWWAIYTAKVIDVLLQHHKQFSPQIFEKYLIKLVGKTADIHDENVLIDAYGVSTP